MWKGEGANRPFSKVCRDWCRALGCFTQIGFNPRKTIFLCSLSLRLTSTVHRRGARSVLNILQTSRAVFRTTPVPFPFYKGGRWKKARFVGVLYKFLIWTASWLQGFLAKCFQVVVCGLVCLLRCHIPSVGHSLHLETVLSLPSVTPRFSPISLLLLSLLWGFDLLYLTFELLKFLCSRPLPFSL